MGFVIFRWTYDRNLQMGNFDKGLDETIEKDWTIINITNDWKIMYPFELK